MSRSQFFIAVGLGVGVPLLVWWALLGAHTRYAEGFSDDRFAELLEGQPREEVLERLGEPLKIVAEDVNEEWCYRAPGNGRLLLAAPGSTTTDLTAGDWCVRFSPEGLLEQQSARTLGELTREQFRLKYGPPDAEWPRGQRERFIYSEPARAEASWEWREVVVHAGKVQRLISYRVNE